MKIPEKAVGMFPRTRTYLGRVSQQRPSVAAMHEVVEMEPRVLYNAVAQTNNPQTIALVVSYLPPDKASPNPEHGPPGAARAHHRTSGHAGADFHGSGRKRRRIAARQAGGRRKLAALSHTGGIKVAAEVPSMRCPKT